MFAIVFIEPDKSAGVHHFRSLEPDSSKLAHDLSKRVVGISSHGRLKDRRIDLQIADANGLCNRGDGMVDCVFGFSQRDWFCRSDHCSILDWNHHDAKSNLDVDTCLGI
jgi:hypothetical protein